MTPIQRLEASAGAHIHTANKASFYREHWVAKNRMDLVLKLDEAVDKALAGDWKPLQALLYNLG